MATSPDPAIKAGSHPESQDDDQEIQAIIQKIKQTYDDGKPFYTKQRLRDMEATLADLDLSKPGSVDWEGIDGNLVRMPVPLEREFEPEMFPFISFKCYDEMISEIRDASKIMRAAAMSSTTIQVATYRAELELGDVNFWTQWINMALAEWTKSNEHGKIVNLLEECDLSNIDKVVCFGLGCPTRDLWYEAGENRVASQHAAAITIAKLIGEETEKHIPVFSQEPCILRSVKDALKTRGVTVYEGAGCASRGFIDIDENTFVISIAPDIPVRSIIADITRPAIMLCDSYVKGTPEQCREFWRARGYDEEPAMLDPTSERVRRMLEDDYDEMPIIGEYRLNQTGPFSRTMLYTRKRTLRST